MSKAKKTLSVGLVSLGCAKNLVDLQVMAGRIVRGGLRLAPSAEKADVILVNTCAFIESARQEAVEQILWACERKAKGKCRAVVVSGCLPQRYADDMQKTFPDIDAIVGVDDLDRIDEVVREVVKEDVDAEEKQPSKRSKKAFVDAVTRALPSRVFDPDEPGLVLSGGPFAYLKIGEGCLHACAFCAIPGIRGRYRSRSMEAILAEAKVLVEGGIRELDLVAQDVTAYGMDHPLGKGPRLVDLLEALEAIPGDFRIRLLYGYPATVTDDILKWMSTSKKVCHYLDIPVQHSHPDVLRLMRRAETIKAVASLATRARELVPDITLRTTMLVGFPGETEEHFQHLVDYVKAAEFDHLGVFAFSPEEGTAAYEMEGEVEPEVAEQRREAIMELQSQISAKRLRATIGRKDRVLLEAPSPENGEGVWIGRASSQAPDDIDGVTYVFGVPEEAQAGELVSVKYVDSDEYDLVAEVVKKGRKR